MIIIITHVRTCSGTHYDVVRNKRASWTYKNKYSKIREHVFDLSCNNTMHVDLSDGIQARRVQISIETVYLHVFVVAHSLVQWQDQAYEFFSDQKIFFVCNTISPLKMWLFLKTFFQSMFPIVRLILALNRYVYDTYIICIYIYLASIVLLHHNY